MFWVQGGMDVAEGDATMPMSLLKTVLEVQQKRKRRMIESSIRKRRKVPRSCESHGMRTRDDDGSLRETMLTDALWCVFHVIQSP